MNRLVLPVLIAFITLSGVWFLNNVAEHETEGEEMEENEQEAGLKRDYFEWLMARDPRTGLIPNNIRKLELDFAKNSPTRQSGLVSALVANNYAAVGPSRNGGRTRALTFDIRNNGTSNRVVLSGGINGGIFR